MSQYLDFTPAASGAIIVSQPGLDREHLSALDFLRDIGKHFPVNQMLSRESRAGPARARAASRTHEFSYQILQANDFLGSCTAGTTARSSRAAATSGATWCPGWI